LSDEVFKLAYGVVESLVREYIDFIEGNNLLILISTIKRFACHHQGIFDYKKAENYCEIC